MQEIELKLEQACADALSAAGVLTGWPSSVQQATTYFDTPDFALAKAGLSLRIRETGGRFVQTVKAEGGHGAGLFARSESQCDVDGRQPVFGDSTVAVERLLGERTSAIAPVFEVSVKRRSWTVRHEGAAIEVASDRGRITAGEREAEFAELELELKDGPVAALFGFARKVDAVTPVRLGVLTKAQRGYLLCGPRRDMFKAEPIALSRDLTAAKAFRSIAESCLRQFRLNEPLIPLNRGAEPLHQARVALRRLRSAFSIFRPITGTDAKRAVLREDLRWLAGELGQARNIDVLLGRVRPGLLHDRLQAERTAAYSRVETVLDSARARNLMLDLVEWLSDGEWLRGGAENEQREQSIVHFAASVLGRYRRKVKRAGRELAGTDDEARHELRKDARKLRYATEFFAALYAADKAKRRHRKFLSALEGLQDQLGGLNDLVTASELLAKFGLGDTPGAAALVSGKLKQSLVDEAVRSHAAFVRAKRFWKVKGESPRPAA